MIIYYYSSIQTYTLFVYTTSRGCALRKYNFVKLIRQDTLVPVAHSIQSHRSYSPRNNYIRTRTPHIHTPKVSISSDFSIVRVLLYDVLMLVFNFCEHSSTYSSSLNDVVSNTTERIKKQRIFCSFYLFARSNLYERQCIMNKIVWMIKVIHTSQLCVICKLPLHASNSTTCIDKMHDHWSCADRCLLYCVTAHIDEWRRSSEICVIFVVFTNTQFDELHRPFAHHQSAFYCSSIFRFSMRWFMPFC